MSKKVAYFAKVSKQQFVKDCVNLGFCDETKAEELYDKIELPKRKTKGSSGYDFIIPCGLDLKPDKTVVVPTGIRCVFTETGYDLSMYPRSGYGTKYGMRLLNTTGIIDNDYYMAENEGHILCKITADVEFTLEPMASFCQGVFREVFYAEEEAVTGVRVGGHGSTGK